MLGFSLKKIQPPRTEVRLSFELFDLPKPKTFSQKTAITNNFDTLYVYMNFLCELLCMSSTQCDLDCVIAKHDTNIEIEKKKFDTSVYGSTSGACTVRCLCMCMRCRHTLTLAPL